MIHTLAIGKLSRKPTIPTVAILGSMFLWISSAADGTEKGTQAVTDSPERRHALELFDQFKMAEAVPLLQQLAAENPQDTLIWERLGVAMVNYADTLFDPVQSKATRKKARSILLKAKELGDNSNLVQTLLSMIPEDGGNVVFSPRKEVSEAMQQAEADFGRGDFDKAIESYQRALLLDPKLYEAALFTGDVYYKQHKPALAGEWFDRAIKINPDRETAYRYWGDALMQENKVAEAKGKFIESVVAEPYSQSSWMGLSQWAKHTDTTLVTPKLKERSSAQLKNGKVSISMESGKGEADPISAAWLAYAMNHALWQTEKFKKEFPAESEYRHTFREEADSLHAMVKILTELRIKEKFQLDSSLSALKQIDEAGLLEPYVFLVRADKDIAVDYAAYRAAHRDLVRRYLNEIVVPGGKK